MSIEDELEQAEQFAPGWRPNEQPTLIGTLTGRTSREGKYGPYEIDTLELDDGGRIAVHRTSKILKEDLVPARVGDRVGIKYLGRHENGWQNYKVVVEPAETSA
jgi:hypothetical protein